MRPAFPASDYYGSSAPSRQHQPTTGLPARQPQGCRVRDRRDGSHVHRMIARPGRCPAMPLPLRHDYAAGIHRGLPTGDINRPKSSPRSITGAHGSPAHIRQIGAGGFQLRGFPSLVSHVHLLNSLAGPRPSGSAGRSRRCQGCFPPSPASPGSGCPQLQHAAATAHRRSPFISARSCSASWRSMSVTHSSFGAVAAEPAPDEIQPREP